MKSPLLIILSLIISLTACNSDNAKKRNMEAREKLNREMADSLKKFEKDLDSLQKAIPALLLDADEMLRDFDRVENPREVEGYYILRSAIKRYPLESTGLIARITNNETLELVAALNGGHFDRIEVSDGSSSRVSDVVPHDQALNYRIGNFTTVAFTGSKADSIAQLIASAPGKITVSFLNPKKTGAVSLSENDKEVIAKTYRLYALRKEISAAERSIPLLSRKAQLLRERLASEQTDSIER